MTATAISPDVVNKLIADQISWTSEQYQQMITAGILTEDDRVELLFGKITEMSPIGRFHAACVRKLNDLVYQQLFGKYSFSFENPIVLTDDSEPEPDFALLMFREDHYAAGHPKTEDVLLVIEVSDHTLIKDRTVKSAVYANAGITEYWIINLIERQIEVYTEPSSTVAEYKTSVIYQEQDKIEHEILGEFSVLNLLP